jgi:hypothetical protein
MKISKETIDELVALRTKQRMANEDYTLALKTQADEHQLSKTALRQYINALENDEVDKLSGTADDLATLLGGDE